MSATEDEIRQRAFALWHQAGRPVDREDEFWYEAERQLKDEIIKHELRVPDTL
jgi:Protein of unknown function (DUF2934)